MKQFFKDFAYAVSVIVLYSFVQAGCTEVQSLINPASTQPITLQARIDQAQRDLDTAWRLANDAHLVGLLSDQQFKFVSTAYPLAQDAINLAGSAVNGKQPDALDLIDAAAKAVAAFQHRIPEK